MVREKCSKATSRDVDLDAVRPDLDTTDQGRNDRFDCLWRLGSSSIGDAVPALNQLPMSDTLVDFVDRVEKFPAVGEESAEPVDDDRFEIARGDPTASRMGRCRHRSRATSTRSIGIAFLS